MRAKIDEHFARNSYPLGALSSSSFATPYRSPSESDGKFGFNISSRPLDHHDRSRAFGPRVTHFECNYICRLEVASQAPADPRRSLALGVGPTRRLALYVSVHTRLCVARARSNR